MTDAMSSSSVNTITHSINQATRDEIIHNYMRLKSGDLGFGLTPDKVTNLITSILQGTCLYSQIHSLSVWEILLEEYIVTRILAWEGRVFL